MVNNSERILNAFSENFFYKELILSDLKYTPIGESERELADIIFLVGNYALAIQLKQRNPEDQTNNEEQEKKWLKRECKEAKKQVTKTVKTIATGNLPEFINNRGQRVYIDKEMTVVPVVMFMNSVIKEYDHVLRKRTDSGLDENCISHEDFCEVCKMLITPMEIVDYFIWRKERFKNNPKVDFMFYIDEDGFSISHPMDQESSIGIFFHEKYGLESLNEGSSRFDIFRHIISNLKERTVIESKTNASQVLVNFFASFTRPEIIALVDKLRFALDYRKNNSKPEIIGSLRNEKDKYAIFIVASKGESLPMDVLFDLAHEKGGPKSVIEIVIYWIDKENYRIDYYCRFI